MKILSLSLVLSLAFAGCSSEAATNAAKDAGGAASTMTGAASAAASKMLDELKSTLAGITNAEQAKSALGSLNTIVPKVSEALKGITGAWPANLTSAADAIREQVTRLSSMADVKAVLGSVLEKITALLPPK